jgi:hypothetical protein
LLEESGNNAWLPRVYFIVHGFVNRWANSFGETLEPLRFGYGSALKSGDMEGSVLLAYLYLVTSFDSGTSVRILEREARKFCQVMVRLGQNMGLSYLVPHWKLVNDLLGGSALSFDQGVAADCAVESINDIASARICLHRCVYHCFMGEHHESLEMAKKSRQAHAETDIWLVFFEGLASLALARTATGRSRRQHIAVGRRASKRLKQWAKVCPENYGNKLALLEAEQLALHEKQEEALTLFQK